MESELLLTPEMSEKLLNRVFDVAKPPPEFRATIKTLIAEVWEESQYKARQHYEQEEPEWAGARHINFDDEQKGLGRPELREALAELEHEQWVRWSKTIAEAETLAPGRLARWKKLWIPYKDLSEEQKDQDRIWVDKSLALIPDIEELQGWYEKLLAEFKTLKRGRASHIEEAKKQERERIFGWVERNSDIGYIYTDDDTHIITWDYNTKCDNYLKIDLGDWHRLTHPKEEK